MSNGHNWHQGVLLDAVQLHLIQMHKGQQQAPRGFNFVVFVPSLG